MAYLGFDTAVYPGDATIQELANGGAFAWVGFYLTSPSHKNPSWMPHRARIVACGLGMAPIYVGQQTQGPGSHVVTPAQGARDGYDAAQLMKIAGFPPGSVCWLDCENGPPFSSLQSGYVGAWCTALRWDGFWPGVYCSYQIAADVNRMMPSGHRPALWAFHVSTTHQHYLETIPAPPDPSGCGLAAAAIWQFADQCSIDVPGPTQLRLTVDLNASTMADPSVNWNGSHG